MRNRVDSPLGRLRGVLDKFLIKELEIKLWHSMAH